MCRRSSPSIAVEVRDLVQRSRWSLSSSQWSRRPSSSVAAWSMSIRTRRDSANSGLVRHLVRCVDVTTSLARPLVDDFVSELLCATREPPTPRGRSGDRCAMATGRFGRSHAERNMAGRRDDFVRELLTPMGWRPSISEAGQIRGAGWRFHPVTMLRSQ